jgi:hypothetical protein
LPSMESPAARFTAVVVFPVPPLLFSTLMIKGGSTVRDDY